MSGPTSPSRGMRSNGAVAAIKRLKPFNEAMTRIGARTVSGEIQWLLQFSPSGHRLLLDNSAVRADHQVREHVEDLPVGRHLRFSTEPAHDTAHLLFGLGQWITVELHELGHGQNPSARPDQLEDLLVTILIRETGVIGSKHEGEDLLVEGDGEFTLLLVAAPVIALAHPPAGGPEPIEQGNGHGQRAPPSATSTPALGRGTDDESNGQDREEREVDYQHEHDPNLERRGQPGRDGRTHTSKQPDVVPADQSGVERIDEIAGLSYRQVTAVGVEQTLERSFGTIEVQTRSARHVGDGAPVPPAAGAPVEPCARRGSPSGPRPALEMAPSLFTPLDRNNPVVDVGTTGGRPVSHGTGQRSQRGGAFAAAAEPFPLVARQPWIVGTESPRL